MQQQPGQATAVQPPKLDFGIIRAISVFYLLFGMAMSIAAFSHARMGSYTLDPIDAVVPGLIVLAAAGTLARKNWGRALSYVISALFLFGVPIGTLVGGIMIVQLSRNRELFGARSSCAAGGG